MSLDLDALERLARGAIAAEHDDLVGLGDAAMELIAEVRRYREALNVISDEDMCGIENNCDIIPCPSCVANAALTPAAQPAEPRHHLDTCPGCGGDADNGFSRSLPPEPYYCTKCSAEPEGRE